MELPRKTVTAGTATAPPHLTLGREAASSEGESRMDLPSQRMTQGDKGFKSHREKAEKSALPEQDAEPIHSEK